MSAPQSPEQQPPATEAKRKRRKWPWIVGAIVLLIVIISAANSGGSGTTTTAAPAAPTTPAASAPAAPAAAAPAPSDGDEITYEVTGKGVTRATSITYVKDKNFGQQQANNVKVPWSAKVNFDSGLFAAQPLTLVAQSGSGGDGEITCRILRNGTEVTSSTSSGPYAVVTCSGGI